MEIDAIIDAVEGAVVELGAIKQAVAELGDDEAAQTAYDQLGTAQHQLGRALVTLLDSVADQEPGIRDQGSDETARAEGPAASATPQERESMVRGLERARERIAAGFYYGPVNPDGSRPPARPEPLRRGEGPDGDG